MIDTHPMPPAVLGDKNALSKQARTEIAELTGRAPVAFLVQAALAWLVIIAAIAWAAAAQNIWVSLLVIFIVATRQNILGLLVHEQAHCLGFKARRGDLLVNLIAAYPLLVLTVEGYAQVHLSHHRFFFTDRDPDFLRKSGPEWSSPMPGRTLARLLLTDILGINLWKLIRGKKPLGDTETFKRPSPTPAWIRLTYYAFFAVLFTLTGTWDLFLLYWLLPLVTVFQAIVRWGAICEHKYNLAGAGIAESSPIIVQRWWEKLLLPNLNFTLHPYHHYFPGIPFSRLPKVHALFEREGLIDERHVFHGYLSYLRYLLGRQETTPLQQS